VMLTDVPRVYADFGTKRQRAIRSAHPDAIEKLSFAAGSMGPKVEGACRFVRETGGWCAIGQLSDLVGIMEGRCGTLIAGDLKGIRFAD